MSPTLRKALQDMMNALPSGPIPTVGAMRSAPLISAGLLGGNAMMRQAYAHRHQKEKEHYAMLARLGEDPRHVPIPLLEQAVRGLIVVMLEQCARPSPQSSPETVTRTLATAASLIARLDRVSDAAYDLGLHQSRHYTHENATLDRMERDFIEESRGRSLREVSVLKNVYRRFEDDVSGLLTQFRQEEKKHKSWDFERRHDYQGRFDAVINTAMDAALIMEAHFEERLFGPREVEEDPLVGCAPS